MANIDPDNLNPVALWRDWFVKCEAQWSDALSTMMKDQATSSALTRQVDELRMMHRLFGEMSQVSLAAANLPSRTDLEALDERLGRLEDGLAQVGAQIASLTAALRSADTAALAGKPTRTRKPAAAATAGG